METIYRNDTYDIDDIDTSKSLGGATLTIEGLSFESRYCQRLEHAMRLLNALRLD